jgi:hypothetical protein
MMMNTQFFQLDFLLGFQLLVSCNLYVIKTKQEQETREYI